MSTNPGDLGCTCYRLRQSARLASRIYDGFLAPSGLGIGQFGILVTIFAIEGESISKLAGVLEMERTTLTRNLGPLQRLGYIEIEPGVDKRARAIRLSHRGREAMQQAMPLWQAAQRNLEEQVGIAKVKTINTTLDEMLGRLPVG